MSAAEKGQDPPARYGHGAQPAGMPLDRGRSETGQLGRRNVGCRRSEGVDGRYPAGAEDDGHVVLAATRALCE
jgi:hypothetical protein